MTMSLGKRAGLQIATALAALLIVLPQQAGAAEYRLYVSGITEHIGDVECQSECNEVNPGLSLRRTVGNAYWQAGAYYNSNYDLSAFLGRGWLWYYGDVTFSAGVGVVTGYQSAVLPFATATVEYSFFYAALIPGAVTVGLRFPF